MQLDILRNIQSISNPILDTFFTLITMSTEIPIIIIITSIIYWCLNKKNGLLMLFSLTTNLVFNTGIKETFKASRPIGIEGINSQRVETATGYSFPSGHTQLGTTFWVSLLSILKNNIITMIGIVMIFLIGISRLYLGVHWPIDVLFGWIFGTIITISIIKIFRHVDESKNYNIYIYMLVILTTMILFIDSVKYIKMLGLLYGVIIGYIIEDKYINFKTNHEIKNQISFVSRDKYIDKVKNRKKLNIKRYIVGILILSMTYLLLEMISIDFIVYEFFKYLMISFTSVAIIPFIFKSLKLD